MDKKKVSITLGIVCIILGLAIAVQIRTVNNANLTVGQTLEDNSLRDEVLKWNEKNDNMKMALEVATKRLDKIRQEATKDDTSLTDTQKEIELNNNLLGLTKLEGQGIEIVIQDDPTATSSTISIFDDISHHIVHDGDLRAIVNELKNAGAEAISINGQRIVNTTAITCIGNVIKINNEKITSPFTIKAIGFSESLAGIDRPGSYIEILREYGIIVTTKKQNKVEIPKYAGAISAKYIKQK